MMCSSTPQISSIVFSPRWRWSQSIWHASQWAHSTWLSSNLDCCRLTPKISSLFLRWVTGLQSRLVFFLSMSSIILHGVLVQVEVGNIKCRYPKKNCIFLLNDSQKRPCVRTAALRGNYCFLVFAGWRQLTSREFGKSFECSRWALVFCCQSEKKDACLCCVTPAILNLLFDIWVDNRQWVFIQREKFTLLLP